MGKNNCSSFPAIFFKIFFLMWTILKSLLDMLQQLLLLFMF